MPSLFPTGRTAAPEDAITSFRGEHFFLSNFFPVAIRLGGIVWPTGEHAYVAAKTTDPQERQRILACRTPGEARRAGRGLTLRPGWEDLRLPVMRAILEQKFRHPDLARRLLATGLRPLEERNPWGDRFWGIDARSGQGENHLGRLLMAIRAARQAELAAQGETCWTCASSRRVSAPGRVACVRPGGPVGDAAADDGLQQQGYPLMPCWERCRGYTPRRLTTRPVHPSRRERAEAHARGMAEVLHLDLRAAIRAGVGRDAGLDALSGRELHALEEHLARVLRERDAAALRGWDTLSPAQQQARLDELLGG